MKTITKQLLTFTFLCLPLGSMQAAHHAPRDEQQDVQAANKAAARHNLPSSVSLGTDPRVVGQMADRILPRNGFEGTVIHDEDVKSFLVANGLDLEAQWEEQFPQNQPNGILQSISSIFGFGPTERNQGIDSLQEALLEGNLDEEQRASLGERLTTISESIRAALQDPVAVTSNPFSVLLLEGDEDIKEKLTSALLEYFKLDNILARAAKGDGYTLDLPSTPLMIISGTVHRALSFARLKQEVEDDESAPTRIDRFRSELFNNHRYDGSDPYWSEEVTEQRKKLHSRIILGSMALGWCSNAVGYKLHYDMMKAQREEKLASNTEATEQFKAESETAAVDTPKVENNNTPVIHKRARTRTISWGSATSEPETKENTKKADVQISLFEYLHQATEKDSVCPVKFDSKADTCPRELEFELLDFHTLHSTGVTYTTTNKGGIFQAQGTEFYLKYIGDRHRDILKSNLHLDTKKLPPYTTSEYVGARLLRVITGNTIANVRLVKEIPKMVASEMLTEFKMMSERHVDPEMVINLQPLKAAMHYVGLGDITPYNMGTIEKDGKYYASRVDYDYSFCCDAPPRCPDEALSCVSYIDGVSDILNIPESYIEDTVRDALYTVACADPNLDVKKAYQIIMDRLNKNKEYLVKSKEWYDWTNSDLGIKY